MPRLKLDTSINRHAFDSFSPIHFSSSRGPRKKYELQVISGSVFSKNREQLATSSPYVVSAPDETEREREEGRDGGRERERETERRRGKERQGGERKKKRGWSIEMERRGRGKKEKQNKIRTVSYAPACMINVAI